MTGMLLHPDEVEGWRGEIRDGEAVKGHETALREEREGEEKPEVGELVYPAFPPRRDLMPFPQVRQPTPNRVRLMSCVLVTSG